MWAKVIRGGTARNAPHDDAAEVFQVEDGNDVIFHSVKSGGAWVKVCKQGRMRWTRSYRITLDGVRADLHFGCAKWLDKPYGRDLTPPEKTDADDEDTDVNSLPYDVTADDGVPVGQTQRVYREVVVVREPEPEPEDTTAREADILNAGVLGFSDVPGVPGPAGSWSRAAARCN